MQNSTSSTAITAPARPQTARLNLMAGVLATTLVLFFAGITQASAHDALEKSSPSDGETLTKTTDTIVLSFNNEVAAVGGKIRVTPKGGETIEGDLTADGKDAIYTLDTPLANDSYTVTWRVVSSDSHPIEGTLEFAVEDPDNAEQPVATTEPTASATDDSATTEPSTDASNPEPTDTAETDAADADSEETSTTDGTNSDNDSADINWTRVGVFGLLGALAGVAVVIFNNKRKKND